MKTHFLLVAAILATSQAQNRPEERRVKLREKMAEYQHQSRLFQLLARRKLKQRKEGKTTDKAKTRSVLGRQI